MSLRHVTVLALEQAVAAPLATRLLAGDGARVIKIERVGEGDFARRYDKFAQGASSYFTWLNYGKESCAIDIKKDARLLDKLVQRADVVVQNLGPGSAANLSLDAQSIVKRFPEKVAVDITGYGPGSSRKAYDLLVTAEAGLCSVTGSEIGGPGRVGVSIADIATGRAAYAGILRALLNKERTGRGAALSVSLFDVVAEMMTVPLLQYRATGKPPSRLGLKHPSIAPYGVFKTSDDESILISCQNEREWVSLCNQVIGSAEIARKFPSNEERMKYRAQVDDIVAKSFAKLTVSEAEALLDKADIAYGRVNGLSGLSAHRFLTECAVLNEFEAPVAMPAEPVKNLLEEKGSATSARVPRVGEHTESIRKEFNELL